MWYSYVTVKVSVLWVTGEEHPIEVRCSESAIVASTVLGLKIINKVKEERKKETQGGCGDGLKIDR